MKKVTRNNLLKMENVLYTSFKNKSLPFSGFFIKYQTQGDNGWVEETFPIGTPCTEIANLTGDFFELQDYVDGLCLGEDVPSSGLETAREGLYLPLDTEYIVYSKQDIRKMIKKLEALL